MPERYKRQYFFSHFFVCFLHYCSVFIINFFRWFWIVNATSICTAENKSGIHERALKVAHILTFANITRLANGSSFNMNRFHQKLRFVTWLDRTNKIINIVYEFIKLSQMNKRIQNGKMPYITLLRNMKLK